MKEDDLKRFGRVKAGYEPINRSTIKKPKSASLWFDDGVVKKKLENNISFALDSSKITGEPSLQTSMFPAVLEKEISTFSGSKSILE